MAREELLTLARELRRRVQLAPEAAWAASAPEREEAPSAPSASAAPGGACARAERLEDLARRIGACRLCPLGETRLKAVAGVGSAQARVLFVGEGPGYQEDHQGEPFVGPSGQLLDRILAAIGLSRQTVFIANIVKCHPMRDPGNPEARGNDRPPTPEEMAACRPYLDELVSILEPRAIVTLGAVAARAMIGSPVSLTRIRGQWREFVSAEGRSIRLLPTYHPAALLRNPDLKKDVWTDMKNLRRELTDHESTQDDAG